MFSGSCEELYATKINESITFNLSSNYEILFLYSEFASAL